MVVQVILLSIVVTLRRRVRRQFINILAIISQYPAVPPLVVVASVGLYHRQ
jgi:hypothetical protein